MKKRINQKGYTYRQALKRLKVVKRKDRKGVGKRMFISEILSRLKTNDKVLDIGTGTADVPIELVKRGPRGVHITGIDITKEMVKEAKKNSKRFRNISIICHNSEKRLLFAKGAFDIVIDRLAPYILREVARVLRPRGIFIFSGKGPKNWIEVVKETRRPHPIYKKLKIVYEKDFETHGFKIIKKVEILKRMPTDFNKMKLILGYAPIVKDFDELKDKGALKRIKAKYSIGRNKVMLTTHEILIVARKTDK